MTRAAEPLRPDDPADAAAVAPRASAPVPRARALGFALTSALLWGVSFPVSRVAVRELAPVALATLRFALATAVLWPLARRRGLRLEPGDRAAIVGLGLLGVTLYFAFENYGLLFTTASHASLIVATVPLGSTAVEAWRRRRLPRPLALTGMAMAVAGVTVIVRPTGGGWRSLLGDLLVLAAMTSWVAYTFAAKRMMARYPALLVTARIMAVGAATLLPLALLEAWFLPPRVPSPTAAGAALYLGLLCSAAAYLMWNLAFPALGVSVANNLLNLVPLISVLTAVTVLGEPFTTAIAAGGALILAGVFVVERVGV